MNPLLPREQQYANFLCGKRCKNKRERERIENEARKKQIKQEALNAELEIEQKEALLKQQRSLDELQRQMQDLMLKREELVIDGLNAAPVATTENKFSTGIKPTYIVTGIILLIAFIFYFNN